MWISIYGSYNFLYGFEKNVVWILEKKEIDAIQALHGQFLHTL